MDKDSLEGLFAGRQGVISDVEFTTLIAPVRLPLRQRHFTEAGPQVLSRGLLRQRRSTVEKIYVCRDGWSSLASILMSLHKLGVVLFRPGRLQPGWQQLIMHPADHMSHRNSSDVAAWKAQALRDSGCRWFVESDVRQAERIHQLSGCKVICPDAEWVFH